MKDINEVTVQIKVQEYNSKYFILEGKSQCFIHKDDCTIVPPVEQQEGQVKYTVDEILNTLSAHGEVNVEMLRGYFVKNTPEPERTPIGTYEGQPIYKNTKAWFVDFEKLSIENVHTSAHDEGSINRTWVENYTELCSKVYLTPEEANKRLRSEVEKKAMQKTFTFEEFYQFEEYSDENPFASAKVFAIELVEKEFNVKYL